MARSKEAAAAKAAEAEHHIALLRALVILFNSVVYGAFLAPGGVPWLAWTVIVLANLYALYVIVARPYRRFRAMTTSTFTAVTDGVLIMAWLAATGGFHSPFYVLWYVSLVAVAFRYDARMTVATGVAYAVAYAGLVTAFGQLGVDPVTLGVRAGYILLCGMLGGLLASASSSAIEDRVRLQADVARSEWFRILAEATSEGIFVHRHGTVVATNNAFCDIVGRPREQVLGHSVLEFVDPAEALHIALVTQQPSDEEVETTVRRPDGTRIRVAARGRDIPLEGGNARVVAVRDVSREVEAEQARRSAREREDELERLRQLDKMRTTFINAAAHELNTPLTPIRLQLHMLRHSGRPRDEKEERVLEMLDRNLQRIMRLVRDILDVSRLQEGRLRLVCEELDLSDAVRHVVDTFSFQAEEHGIHMSSDIPPGMRVQGDRQRLEQVFVNLVSNAIRFTPKGGAIHVTARPQGDETVEVAVQDTGVGITEDQKAHLFQPFSQQHVEVDAAGLGLGLYITQGLVEAHNGTIVVDSAGTGKGTRVSVLLPVEGRSFQDDDACQPG